MSNMEVALQLLGVGMVTVFLILFLVVLIGNTIIRFINRFMPEAEKPAPAAITPSSAIDPRKMSAIVAAIQQVTNGKGKVVNIEKV
ncbi:MAG: OadG family protein [Prolixibacteraceae bacterium]|nr:OadG family protein [Prolixibacteraceae bacterium]